MRLITNLAAKATPDPSNKPGSTFATPQLTRPGCAPQPDVRSWTLTGEETLTDWI